MREHHSFFCLSLPYFGGPALKSNRAPIPCFPCFRTHRRVIGGPPKTICTRAKRAEIGRLCRAIRKLILRCAASAIRAPGHCVLRRVRNERSTSLESPCPTYRHRRTSDFSTSFHRQGGSVRHETGTGAGVQCRASVAAGFLCHVVRGGVWGEPCNVAVFGHHCQVRLSFKPLPSFLGLRLPTRVLQFQSQKHRNRRVTAQRFGGGMGSKVPR